MENLISYSTDIIHVKQLPIIEEQLRSVKDSVEQITSEAAALVCTEETIQTAKTRRAEINKMFSDLEAKRKEVKSAVMEPYDRFEAVYKECISEPFKAADAALKGKIDEVETELKRRCEDGLREYFDELCAAHGIDWLKYEQAGIKVDMTSAKQKTPKKLREQLVQFVVGVSRDIETIDGLENAGEILTEYKLSLNAVQAIGVVQDRHQRIKVEEEAKTARKSARDAQAEAIRKVEALAPPTVESKPETVTVTFTVTDTRERLIALRSWLQTNGYEYK